MDFNSLSNGVNVPRYIRLYNLASKRQAAPKVASPPKTKKPRRRVEIDLMLKYSKTQSKIHIKKLEQAAKEAQLHTCLLYTSPSPRDS